MPKFYARWISAWERKLAARDQNRVVREFEWGLDWLGRDSPNGISSKVFNDFVEEAVADSDGFFACRTPNDYRLKDGSLTFSSPLASPYPPNNVAYASYFPVHRDGGRAVLVLPQWNADQESHTGLCRLLNRCGIAALRLSLAYHDRRMPPELERADYHVSSNLGRTIHAYRQSVVDARACIDWLEQQGYGRIGILGTSLGSCIAFITAAHDRRISTGVFNHVSMFVGDVIWTGLSTRHIRQSLAGSVTQDELRKYWSVISPAAYLGRLPERGLKTLLIWARYDATFLPVYSLAVLEYFRRQELPHRVFSLPCGHYTTGQFPFNLLDGLVMCDYLRRNL